MSIRKLKLPNDLDKIYNVIVESFQYPENPEWNADQDEVAGIKDTVTTIRRIWPLYRMISWTSPTLRDALLGWFWVEDGQTAGMVSIARRGSTDTWLIGNVAVTPNFRRRGIARKLVEHSLEYIRKQGGTLAVLDVIDGNLPAYKLYDSLGFEHYSSRMELASKSEKIPPLPEIPGGFRFEKITDKDWQIQLEMAKRVVPVKVQSFDPITEARYKRSLPIRIFTRTMNKMQGIVTEDFAIRDLNSKEFVALGFTTAQTKSSGRHNVNLSLKPEYAELVPYIIQKMLHKVKTTSAKHTVEAALWEWRYFTFEEHHKHGFEKVKEWHRMGLNL